MTSKPYLDIRVAPFTGAWIEMEMNKNDDKKGKQSHPSRVRGLKSALSPEEFQRYLVAPFTGAWIEIDTIYARVTPYGVAPFTGAWIEIE